LCQGLTLQLKKNRFLFAQRLSVNGGKDKKPKKFSILRRKR
jgi:hypothetical protein